MRPIANVEVEILRLLTSVEFDGVEQLRAQVATIREVELNCTCGCPSFTPAVDRTVAPPSPGSTVLPTELTESDRDDGMPRTVIWFRDEAGYIANVECVYYDDAIDEWPDPQRCTIIELSPA